MPKTQKSCPAFRVTNSSDGPVKVQTKMGGKLVGHGFIVAASNDRIRKITAPFDELYFRAYVKDVSRLVTIEFGELRGSIFEVKAK